MQEQPEVKALKPLLVEEPRVPEELPVVCLRDMVIYPGMAAPLAVARQKSIRAVDEALNRDRLLGLFAQKSPEIEDPKPEQIYDVGSLSVIVRMMKAPDNTQRLIVHGLMRIRVVEWIRTEPFFLARVEKVEETVEEDTETEALKKSVLHLFQRMVQLTPQMPEELHVFAMNIEHPGRLADFVASNIPSLKVGERQEILSIADAKLRLRRLVQLLGREVELLELTQKIQMEAKSQLDKMQREFFLRQQLEAIRKELGEEDEREAEIRELRQRAKEAGLPEEAIKAVERELDRMAKMPPQAAEYIVSRTYVDWLISLPWNRMTEDNLDIEHARKVLDEDHYNLERVKERILEYLAVKRLKPDAKGPILCFVGPPGVGKTSLGKSIARALGRKFVRISLGGVRDEAEIRGHRRTYVGALPGRIIQAIRRVGTKNPVFMLDEVDKIGADFRGDPAAALLEVLDPEQNHAFSDHYIEVPFDLSKVMFICTANIVDPIPPALRDRMEIIHLPGYVEEEKLEIAKRYLIPRQIEENGLSPENVSFTDGAIRRIIREYTREAGVRNLEREIAAICRKVAVEVAEKGPEVRREVTEENLEEFLGAPHYTPEIAERQPEVGVATGMAWTERGGEILFVEATKMRGKGNLILTGHLGEVMKESAQAALSYIRSKAEELKISPEEFVRNDVHVHVPSGAIPKDGPSAGITIAAALASLFTGRPVRHDVAMTGEITLRGKVLPVGGIREKALAAKRAGIKNILLPKQNRKDVEEIPENVREGLNFIYVESIDQALKVVLLDGKEQGG